MELDRDRVLLADGAVLSYDALVVVTGSVLQPEETEGLTGPGWSERAFTFYDLAGVEALAGALERFTGGRLVPSSVRSRRSSSRSSRTGTSTSGASATPWSSST